MIQDDVLQILSRHLSSDVVIILDDGHGWETPGKRAPDFDSDGHPDIKENHFNSAVQERLCMLFSMAGIKVVKLAPEYWDKPLRDRSKLERQITASEYTILMSIHANAANYKAHGYESFIRDDESMEESMAMSKDIEAQLRKHLPDLRMRGTKISSKEGYNFHILRETQSEVKILTEAAFMTNERESDLLQSDEFIETYTMCNFIGMITFMESMDLLSEELPMATAIVDNTTYADPEIHPSDGDNPTTDTTTPPQTLSAYTSPSPPQWGYIAIIVVLICIVALMMSG